MEQISESSDQRMERLRFIPRLSFPVIEGLPPRAMTSNLAELKVEEQEAQIS